MRIIIVERLEIDWTRVSKLAINNFNLPAWPKAE